MERLPSQPSLPLARCALALALALGSFLAGCSFGAAAGRKTEPVDASGSRRLYLVHASDMESEILPREGRGGIARFQALARGLAEKNPHLTLVLAAGDTFMPAPTLEVEVGGRPAPALANGMWGLRASALGNHEFDKGEAFLAEMVSSSSFPFLTATVDFSGGPLDALRYRGGSVSAPWLEEHPGRILSRGKLCVGIFTPGAPGGECDGFAVGVVGATTELLGMVASIAPSARSLPDLPAVVQALQVEVDALEAEGLDIVILLSHLQGVHRELELLDAGLRGVDVIVAGGGDDRLANADNRLLPGDRPAPICARLTGTCYPIVRKARDGETVLVVATDGQYRYIGWLGVAFDEAGRVRWVDPVSGPWPVDDVSLSALDVREEEESLEFEAAVREALAPSREIVGTSRRFLHGEREEVRNRETNLGNLTADSLAHRARRDHPDVAFALRNGGGIRASIGSLGQADGTPSPISLLDVQVSLRFDDSLVVVETSHRRLVETFEASLRGVGSTRGHFPQVSEEVFVSYDPRGREQVQEGTDGERGAVVIEGARVRTLLVKTKKRTIEVVRDGKTLTPDAVITFATLEYLARGGDGYFPEGAGPLEVVPVVAGGPVGEQAAFLEFLRGEAWGEGERYVDPIPGELDTFFRIREVQAGQGNRSSVAQSQREVGHPSVGR